MILPMLENENRHSYYVGNYRIVHISEKWRICTPDKKDYNKWNFINNVEYETAGDAMANISEETKSGI